MLTVKDINDGYTNEEWLGHGYLSVRREWAYQLDTAISAADDILLGVANANGWTKAQLFMFCNSTWGRHFGEEAIAGYGNLKHINSCLQKFEAWWQKEMAR